MHLNQITSPQPQQQKLEFRLNCDRQSADCEALYLRPKITAFSAENEKKTKMKIHFRPKTKMAETIKNSHFRRRKRKRISVGLYLACCSFIQGSCPDLKIKFSDFSISRTTFTIFKNCINSKQHFCKHVYTGSAYS